MSIEGLSLRLRATRRYRDKLRKQNVDLQAKLAAADETIAELVRALQLVAVNDPTAAYAVTAALARVRLEGETK